MERKIWVATYRDRDGKEGTATFEWPNTPSIADAAIRIRDQLLPDGFLLPDMPRNSDESPAVFLLKSYGFEILSIVEQTDSNGGK